MKITLESIGENTFVQEVGKGLIVWLDSILFKENVVSKIVVFKFQGSDGPNIFVELYMGNIEIATWIVSEVVITETRYSSKNNPVEGDLRGYNIRLPYEFEQEPD